VGVPLPDRRAQLEAIQRGGFASEQDARASLERALEKLRRANGGARMLTLAELVERYLAQHEVSPVTLEKLRWLLKHVVAFGGRRLDELQPHEIAAWRMTMSPGASGQAGVPDRPERRPALPSSRRAR
jgi:hypothetical protein